MDLFFTENHKIKDQNNWDIILYNIRINSYWEEKQKYKFKGKNNI